MPTANEIRRQFIDFFTHKHGHTFVPSASVVPLDDPTLMFTNAGMNQFKDVFLGTGTRPYKRAVNSQKCIRVSGKHNDLEEVGRDTYHHTFFEMLGNWSFGDYYKREAIQWAWELLTEVWKIDKSRLHATVFGGDKEFGLAPDDEAGRLWLEMTDIDPSRVHRFGKKDNFWMMGEVGPCGPCSEIHIDRTPDHSGGPLVNAGDPRVMEIWNLVFIQYNRDDAGKLTPLPAKHVDTGMGFERVCALLQGKESNYDTDVFGPIMDAIGKLTGKKYGGKLDDLTDVAMRVVADHLRMATFAITDGAWPSNKDQGYEVRRVLRRAVRFCWQYFGQREPMIYRLVPVLVDHMANAFPELSQQAGRVTEIVRQEEADFLKTVDRELPRYRQIAERAKDSRRWIEGKVVFDLTSTHGLPIDIIQQMALEDDLTLDLQGYEQAKQEHREKSAAKAMAGVLSGMTSMEEAAMTAVMIAKRSRQLSAAVQSTLGTAPMGTLPTIQEIETDDRPKWFGLAGEGELLGWIDDNQFVSTGRLDKHKKVGLILDQTCFYAEAGGQVGDRGSVITPTGSFHVEQTAKVGNAIVHLGHVSDGWIEVGQTATLAVDPERDFTRKNHTATHLLHWALQRVLGEHVEQRGSKVKPDEFTFDFSHTGPMTEEEKAKVEQMVNEKIYANLPVTWRELPIADAKQLPGVRAFFGDKYGEVVRVVEIHENASAAPMGPIGPIGPMARSTSPEDDIFSREFCGGTHLSHTGQAGFFKIVGEEAVGKGVRRLTCVTGREAVNVVQKLDATLAGLAGRFRCKPEEVPARVESLQEEIKKLQQQLKKGASTDLAGVADKLLANATEVNGAKVIVGEVPAGPEEQIRQQVDRLRQKAGSAVVVLGWTEDGKVQLLTAVTDDLVKKGLHAGKLVGQVAKVVGGGGGGKPTMAQAGGKEPAKLPLALELAKKLASEQLAK